MANTAELEALRRDREANHSRKMAALGQLGEVIQAARRTGERAFRPGGLAANHDRRALLSRSHGAHGPGTRGGVGRNRDTRPPRSSADRVGEA